MENYIWWSFCIAGGIWSSLLTAFASVCWARMKGAEQYQRDVHVRMQEALDAVVAKVPESRLQELETTISAFRRRIDTSALENDAYREAVHKSMQRFDSIMRRNERALVSKAEKSLTEEDVDDTPDEIPLGDVAPPNQTGRNRPSRAELRAQLRARIRR